MWYFNILESIARRLATAKSIRYYSLITMLLCGVNGVMAQYIEQVHLKNGSVIKGVITEQVPNQFLKIQTADGSSFVYSYHEIEQITKEAGKIKSVGQNQTPSKDSKTPRYEGGVCATVAYIVTNYDGSGDRFGYGIATTHGCLISPHLYIGGGAGINLGSYTSIPIFADFRGYFIKGHLKPYADLKLGYDVFLNGVYLYPAIGLRYKYLDFSAGFQLKQPELDYNGLNEYRRTFVGSVAFNLGVRF